VVERFLEILLWTLYAKLCLLRMLKKHSMRVTHEACVGV
jgi:hypothetical protein